MKLFNNKWQKYIPNELSIVTSNGNFTLKLSNDNTPLNHRPNVTNLSNCIQIVWYQNTPSENGGDVLKDGEPDYLGFDITIIKNNSGKVGNSDNIKLDIDLTYGDAMVSEFSINNKNGKSVIDIIHYTGIGSKYDKDTQFGFTDESILDLVTFFNLFGFTLTKDDFNFLDKYPDTFTYTESIKLTPSFKNKILVINNTKPQESRYLNHLLDLLKSRGVEYVVASTENDIDKHIEDCFGCISSGSEYDIDDENKNFNHLNIKKPLLGINYGFQQMCKQSGCDMKKIETPEIGNMKLTNCTDHPLFKNVDIEYTQFNFTYDKYIEDCPNGFEPIAFKDDVIVGISDDKNYNYGVMFHPEELEQTQTIIDNFIEICNNITKNVPNKMKYIQTFENFRNKLWRKY